MTTLPHTIYTAKKDYDRLDYCLLEYEKLSSLFGDRTPSRSHIARKIKNQTILLNEKPAKTSTPIHKGDSISITMTKDDTNNQYELDSSCPLPFPPIIKETLHFIAIDKPAGLQVHPSPGKTDPTLADIIATHKPELRDIGDDPQRPGIVHRLDADTSGILLIAKSQDAFTELKHLFKKRLIRKTYSALVHGAIGQDTGVIDLPLVKNASFSKMKIAGENEKNTVRDAITEFFVIKRYQNYTLLKLSPKTGRTHQLRIHLRALGHPIVGDQLYGEKMKENLDLHRQFLHAKRLQFDFLGKSYALESPLPNDLQYTLKRIDEATKLQ